MCAPCFKNLAQQHCPTCRGQYDVPARRSLLAEELVSGATFTVSCSNVACQEMVEGRGMKTHMAVCQHRVVPCPYSACNEEIALDLVTEHIVLVHQALLLDSEVRVNCLSFDLDLDGFMNEDFGEWNPMVRV